MRVKEERKRGNFAQFVKFIWKSLTRTQIQQNGKYSTINRKMYGVAAAHHGQFLLVKMPTSRNVVGTKVFILQANVVCFQSEQKTVADVNRKVL